MNLFTEGFKPWKGLLLVLVMLGLVAATGFKTELKKDRPFRAIYQTTVTVLEDEPPLLVLLVMGTGTATHLGQSTLESETTVDESDIFLELSGSPVFTAANGDLLYTTFTGRGTPESGGAYTLIREFTITGGTGRFARATGHFTGYSTGMLDPAGDNPSVGTISMKGVISY